MSVTTKQSTFHCILFVQHQINIRKAQRAKNLWWLEYLCLGDKIEKLRGLLTRHETSYNSHKCSVIFEPKSVFSYFCLFCCKNISSALISQVYKVNMCNSSVYQVWKLSHFPVQYFSGQKPFSLEFCLSWCQNVCLPKTWELHVDLLLSSKTLTFSISCSCYIAWCCNSSAFVVDFRSWRFLGGNERQLTSFQQNSNYMY